MTEGLKKAADYSGDPWVSTNPYFEMAEASMKDLWGRMVWPFIKECDFNSTLDLAAGHGRNSEMLQYVAGQLTISDIQSGNVEICKKRFASRKNTGFFVGNGFDFQPLETESLTMIYCFDAMVHFEPSVIESYLRDTPRVLKPGGYAFYHHSNDGTSTDWRKNQGARNQMTKDKFAQLAEAAGLEIANQRVINWDKYKDLDCLSLLRRSLR